LSAESQPTLAVALSARPLAAAARRAGASVVTLDLFADDDTVALATAAQKITAAPLLLPQGGSGSFVFDHEALIKAVEKRCNEASGIVYGAGFEQEPALLATLEAHLPILGNRADVVARVKDPFAFAALLAKLGASSPETAREASADGTWLVKRIGGSGGGHIGFSAAGAVDAGSYVQRRVAGRAVSALFLGDGRKARVLGYSEQWTSPTLDMPFRFGGCVGPVSLTATTAAALDELCHALTGALGLVGLNSLDLMLDGERFHVLEINPRPGATLDIFDGRDGVALWRAHVDAVAGRLAPLARMTGAPRAAALAYAPARCRIPSSFPWPGWTADRGGAGVIVEGGAPVCTVMATAATPARARAIVERRARRLLERLEPLPLAAA
jgi:uncharacterized protein